MTMSETDSSARPPGALRYASMARGPRWIWLNGRSVPVLFGAQDDDVDDDETVEDVEESEVDDTAESNDDDGRIKSLTEEAKRHRLRAKKYRQDAERQNELVGAIAKHFHKEVADLSLGTLTELLRSTGPDADQRSRDMESDLGKAVGEVERLSGELHKRDVDDAIRDALLAKGFQSKRIPSALRLIDRDDIEMDDGKVEGITDAVDKMADDYPEWLSAQPSDDGNADNGAKPPAAKSTGKRGAKGQIDLEYLRNKYPSLRH
jgi:hypothetical protein